MEQNAYQRACALWVAQRTGKDASKISDVDFIVVYGGYCETCGYQTTGISYYYSGSYQELELGTTSMAEFLEEAIGLME